MISSGQLTSILIPPQLPEFVRDNPDYSNFVLFIQAYYEWLEQTNNVTDRTKNLLNYKDVDNTTNEFVDYFYNDFLQYFPKNILANKTEVLKVAKQLYQSKGTPAAYKFLFRTLYNSDVEFFNTKDAVFKASAGKWYIAKSLKLSSQDTNFLITKNLRVIGETTKSIATIENVVLAQNKMEVFISNIERLFQSGEFIRVVDGFNQDVYFLNGQIVPVSTSGAKTLRAKIVGQISQILIGSTAEKRGQLYQGANTITGYPGDPVAVYGGLNTPTGHGAAATIGTTTKGSIKSITVANTSIPGTNTTYLLGGFGYSPEDSTQSAYSIINIINGGGAIANITGVNTATSVVVGDSTYNPVSTITNIITDRIGSKTAAEPSKENAQFLFDTANGFILHSGISLGVTANANTYIWNGSSEYSFANNIHANATTKLANAFTFISFFGYPISAVTVLNQGGGLTQKPPVFAQSLYKTQDTVSLADLGSLGILGPIRIDNPGKGYSVNDKIIISNGTGYGAYANVTSVAANGAITNVAYVYSTTNLNPIPLGGLGYKLTNLPTVSVSNSYVTGSNVANLSITGIVGQGASFNVITDRVGSITTINISDYGEDYIFAPNVSFKVQDIVVTGLGTDNIPIKGDILYQGSSLANATYFSTVDSLYSLKNNIDPTKNIYTLRVFNYSSTPNIALPIHANNKSYSLTITDDYKSTLISLYAGLNSSRYANGVITYGDGTAQGNVTFLNGLTIGQGQYLDTSGQVSSFDVLQSFDYNNYTYQITLEKEIAKYRTALLNLLHPTGLKVRGRFAMKSNSVLSAVVVDALQTGRLLYDSSGANASFVQIGTGNFSVPSTNILQFGNLLGANIANIIFSNNVIQFTTANGRQFKSEVNTINYSSNTVTLKDNVWLTFSNVANISASAGQNTINITNVYTAAYNVFNNGIYNNANNPLADIINTGDYVLVNNVVYLVTSNSTTNGVISSLTVNTNLTYAATGNLSVSRILSATAQYVKIFGPIGYQYVPQLSDEFGNFITTETGNNFILIN